VLVADEVSVFVLVLSFVVLEITVVGITVGFTVVLVEVVVTVVGRYTVT